METTITLTIDGQTVTVPEGSTILKAANSLNINIPTICFHPSLTPLPLGEVSRGGVICRMRDE
jgi:predicted molibdopterin-dependent oxidoreductase YjgC